LKINQATAACERIFEVFDWKTHVLEPAEPKSLSGLKDCVEIRDIRFAYPDAPDRQVLNGLSLKIPKGKVVALVGASGAGKSSLVSLIPRIYDVTSGSITVDGIDIRDVSTRDLRSMIAVVSQDIFLFDDTIEANIRCGRLDATAEEIREAAKHAHALDFIESLPNGFQSHVGERGQKLSGGEKQRVSIARAFLRHAPLLILDEATSSLDNASERAVQSALEELMQNRTTLVIAHRLSTIRNADEIVVIREGRVIEQGRHELLLEKRGEYFKLHEIHRA
jgi:ABC-type multidrug transport system fused ATPase/permease subunit